MTAARPIRRPDRGRPARAGFAVPVAALCLGAAGALPAAARTEAETKAMFIEIIAAHGCAMSEAEARDALPRGGVTMDESEPVVDALISAGQATFKDGTLRLTGDICHARATTDQANADQPADIGALFLGLVRDNGCRMNEKQAEAILPPKGIGLDLAEGILKTWVANGEASFDGDVLELGDALCAGARQADAATQRPFSDFETELVTAIRRNGCRMDEDGAKAQLPGLGLDVGDALDAVGQWRDEGLAAFDGDVVVLAASLCNAHGIDESDAQGRRAAFIGVIEANGCSMTEDEAASVLPAAGFDKDETKALAGALIGEGLAAGAAGTLTLKTENCTQ